MLTMVMRITSPNTILYGGLFNSALGLCTVLSLAVLCSGIQRAMLKGLIFLCASAEQQEGHSSYSYTYTQHDHCTHNLHAQREREDWELGLLKIYFFMWK